MMTAKAKIAYTCMHIYISVALVMYVCTNFVGYYKLYKSERPKSDTTKFCRIRIIYDVCMCAYMHTNVHACMPAWLRTRKDYYRNFPYL